MTAGEIVREVVPPLATVWVLILGMLWTGSRERREDRPWPPSGSSAVTVLVGFALFLLFVAVFQTLATGDEGALPSAVSGGGGLLGIALAGFLVLSGIRRLIGRRRT